MHIPKLITKRFNKPILINVIKAIPEQFINISFQDDTSEIVISSNSVVTTIHAMK